MGRMAPERLRVPMYTPGVAEFSGSDAGCFPVSLSTMLTDTSGYSSIEVASSFLKQSCLANLEELELDLCSVIDLAFAGGRHVQSSGADASLLCQCGGDMVDTLLPFQLISEIHH